MADAPLPALPVGWIGTGRMGAPMARRLARAGADLTVWNRTRSKAEPLAAEGARIADSLGELADRAVVFTMVSASADLEEVLVGPGGLLADGGPVPSVVVDCSTISTDTSAAMREAAARRGARFLAAPVSGNGKVAAAGRLTIVASGPEDAFDLAAPFLRGIAASVTYAGEGEGARLVKICHNVLLGVLIQSLTEVTVLAEKGGVSRAALLDFLNNSVLGSTFTRYKTPALVKLDYTPTFTPVLLRKDFDLGLAAARELGVPLPLAALTQQIVQGAISTGHSAEDFAVLLELQAASAGLRLEPEAAEVDDGLG
ncbi:MAG TPA: NAD(P)-dependent oxidoreductase [Actinocrinis sp.]|nr:NAD(P)-dependent oxidoreductase [Actinocrinis sp.]